MKTNTYIHNTHKNVPYSYVISDKGVTLIVGHTLDVRTFRLARGIESYYVVVEGVSISDKTVDLLAQTIINKGLHNV